MFQLTSSLILGLSMRKYLNNTLKETFIVKNINKYIGFYIMIIEIFSYLIRILTLALRLIINLMTWSFNSFYFIFHRLVNL